LCFSRHDLITHRALKLERNSKLLTVAVKSSLKSWAGWYDDDTRSRTSQTKVG
jgi:hypothetical protein